MAQHYPDNHFVRKSRRPPKWTFFKALLEESLGPVRKVDNRVIGVTAVLQALLEFGADINGAAHHGLTVLHLAVVCQRLDLAQGLVEHGADMSRRDDIHNCTPLGTAERRK